MDARPAVHPSPETLKAFGQRTLDSSATQEVNAHLDTCQQCRQAVAGLVSDPVATLPPLRPNEDARPTPMPSGPMWPTRESAQVAGSTKSEEVIPTTSYIDASIPPRAAGSSAI